MGHVLRCIERNGRYPGEQAAAELDRCTASPADFLFTTEEAHGFLLSPEVRDKDACGAGVFLAGLASDLADIGCDLSGYLHDIYKVYGYHAHVQRSLVMEGIDGVERMARIQNVLRKKPLQTVAGMAVEEFRDHRVYGGPLISDSDAANRNVLQFWLRGDRGETARLVVRPSGTEPKTKIYVEVPETRITKGIFDDTSVEQRSVISDAQLVEIMKETKKRAARIAEAFIRYCLGREIHGDDVGELPDELLLIPDMVPVDRKLIYCREILPAFCEQVRRGENPHEWLISEQTRLMGREGPAHGQAALDHRLQKEGLPPV
jgi:hypothetical protein